VRDAVAGRLLGVGNPGYETSLVDLVFCAHEDVCSYEGTYILGQQVDRRSHRASMGWPTSGKRNKCTKFAVGESEETRRATVDEVAIVLEYKSQRRPWQMDGRPGGPTDSTRLQCGLLETRPRVDLLYPRCSFLQMDLEFCDDPAVAQTYARVVDSFRVIPDDATARYVDRINVSSFVRMLVAQLLLEEPDFPSDSLFMSVPPASVGDPFQTPRPRLLYAGPVYDVDGPGWRAQPFSYTWDTRLTKLTPSGQKVMPFWRALAADPTFLERVRAEGPAMLDAIEHRLLAEYRLRREQAEAGFFVENDERWRPWGGRYYHNVFADGNAYGDYFMSPESSLTRASMIDDLEFSRQCVIARGAHLRRLLPRVTHIELVEESVARMVGRGAVRLRLLIVFGALSLVGAIVLGVGLCCARTRPWLVRSASAVRSNGVNYPVLVLIPGQFGGPSLAKLKH
jgi:hypothetical protein